MQAFTRDGAKDPTITVGASTGTWNTNKQSMTLEGQVGPVNYILNTYQYVTDGYRDFSQYRRDNFNGKISYQFSPDTKFTFVGNYMDQPYTNDPNALTPSEFASNSRQAGANAVARNSRLYRINSYGGIIIDHNLSEKDSLRFVAYSGSRSNLQYLTTSAAAEIIRDTEGFDFRWTRKDLFLNKTGILLYSSLLVFQLNPSFLPPLTSTSKNPSTKYNIYGHYLVSLKVTSNNGCDTTLTKAFTVKVLRHLPAVTVTAYEVLSKGSVNKTAF